MVPPDTKSNSPQVSKVGTLILVATRKLQAIKALVEDEECAQG
jgi:hypothetical protein